MNDIICPSCGYRGKLEERAPRFECEKCRHIYERLGEAWDFRTVFKGATNHWTCQEFDRNYRKTGRFIDGYEHAEHSGIPAFIEDYRISRIKDKIASRLIQENNGRLLDIGCGNGWYDFRLKEKWQFAGQIIGIDISPFQINCYLDEIKRRMHSNMDALCANGEAIPFPDNYFDKVVLTEVLEHVASPRDVMLEISRVLRPGGLLFLTTPSGPTCTFWKRIFWPLQTVKRFFVPSQTNVEEQIYDVPLSKGSINGFVAPTDLDLVEYQKAVFLPHESYLQFFPLPTLRFLLLSAYILECMSTLTMFLGLHHFIVMQKHENKV